MYGADWTAERVVDCLTVALSRPIFAGAESERLPRKDLFVIRRMTDSNHVIRKKRGRPSTGHACRLTLGGQNLPFFAPSLLALLIRGGQSHPDQTPDGVGTGWMAGLPAAPFINVLLPLQLKSKTDDWSLPNPRATALFSYYNV
jgi:hypothetical protein